MSMIIGISWAERWLFFLWQHHSSGVGVRVFGIYYFTTIIHKLTNPIIMTYLTKLIYLD